MTHNAGRWDHFSELATRTVNLMCRRYGVIAGCDQSDASVPDHVRSL
jgi:hypothetical protein